MRRIALLVFAGGLTAASVWFLWGSNVPLGIDGEWTWDRIRNSSDQQRNETQLGIATAAGAFCVYAVFVFFGARRLAADRRRWTACWLLSLSLAGFGWLWIVQEAPRTGYGFAKAAWVPYYPSVSGYYHEARHKIDSTSEFLSGYEDRIQSDDATERVLHIGTHPPGLFLFHRSLIELCEHNPGLVDFLRATRPASIENYFNEVIQPRPLGGTFTEVDRAAIWLGVLVTQWLAALTVMPLYCLIRSTASRKTAWMVASMWPLVPAVAVFLPKSDAVYPFLATWFLATWVSACRNQSLWRAVVAGVLFFVGVFLSLAFLPVAALAAWLTFCIPSAFEKPVRAWRNVACATLGLATPCAVLWFVFQLNLPRVWWLNYQNHAEFYEQFTRTWSSWLTANVVEGVMAIGTPIISLAIFSAVQSLMNRRLVGVITGTTLIWGGLWLSGKNMGEAARLWLIFNPWILWIAGAGCESEEPRANRTLWAILLLQGLACIATVMRVSGFPLHLPVDR